MKPHGTCPECGYKFTDYTSAIGGPPDPMPGDFTVCINCGGVLQFTVDDKTNLTVLSASLTEIAKLMMQDLRTYKELCRVQQVVLCHIAKFRTMNN